MTFKTSPLILASVASLLTLAGCFGDGGGGGDPVADTTEPPNSASASEAGFVAYVAEVAATPDASAPADPVVLDNFTVPASAEDGLPVPTSADDTL